MLARCVAILVVVWLMGCSPQRIVATPEGFRPEGAAYRLTPAQGGSPMPANWAITSHERHGAELVKKSWEKSDFRARRAGGGELVFDTWILPDSMIDGGAREMAERLFQALCSSHSSGLTMTPFGLGVRSESIFYGSHTLATKDLSVGQLSAYMFAFVRSGLGPKPELTFLIMAYHQRHSPHAYTVTLAAPPTEFDSALPDAIDFTERLHLDGVEEMPSLPSPTPSTPPRAAPPVPTESPYPTTREI
jgi:hypothetical protein